MAWTANILVLALVAFVLVPLFALHAIPWLIRKPWTLGLTALVVVNGLYVWIMEGFRLGIHAWLSGLSFVAIVSLFAAIVERVRSKRQAATTALPPAHPPHPPKP